MQKTGWKALAIVSIILLIVSWIFFCWIVYLGTQEIEKETQCAYNICSESTIYVYSAGVCECYSYDILGNAILDKTEYIE